MNIPTNHRFYKVFLGVLFSFLFAYILLRIIYNETLHDEVATYMFYFYHGEFIGQNIHWDANNHLLNSFLGNLIYRTFGDNFTLLRLPNLLAFVLYFLGTIRLTKEFTTAGLKFTSILALNSIPFIIEYFGYARGYGLSFGFFIWALVHLNTYLKINSLKSLLFTYIFLILTVASNLTFVNSIFILLGIVVISPFFRKEKRSALEKVKEGALHTLFIACLAPFIYFGLLLKKGGALYYGSLDGLWDVTGKSLSKYVLFIDFDWLQFFYLLVFGAIIFYTILLLRKLQRKDWFSQPILTYVALFFGNIIGILILAFFFDVNYPEDRTGMYLVILFLFILFHVLDTIQVGKWLQFLFLFFPISLLFNLSLHSSVFSPDQRISKSFYVKIKEQITPEMSIGIYQIMKWNWPYLESHSKEKASVGQISMYNKPLSDVIITVSTFDIPLAIQNMYDTIAVDKQANYIAFKRKIPLLKIPVNTIKATDFTGVQEYYNYSVLDCEKLVGKNVQITVKGHLQTQEVKNKLQLVVAVFNKDGSSSRSSYYSFETVYQGQLIDNDFLHHFVLDSISKDEKEIKVYLWNRGFDKFTISNTIIDIFELKSPENEPR